MVATLPLLAAHTFDWSDRVVGNVGADDMDIWRHDGGTGNNVQWVNNGGTRALFIQDGVRAVQVVGIPGFAYCEGDDHPSPYFEFEVDVEAVLGTGIYFSLYTEGQYDGDTKMIGVQRSGGNWALAWVDAAAEPGTGTWTSLQTTSVESGLATIKGAITHLGGGDKRIQFWQNGNVMFDETILDGGVAGGGVPPDAFDRCGLAFRCGGSGTFTGQNLRPRWHGPGLVYAAVGSSNQTGRASELDPLYPVGQVCTDPNIYGWPRVNKQTFFSPCVDPINKGSAGDDWFVWAAGGGAHGFSYHPNVLTGLTNDPRFAQIAYHGLSCQGGTYIDPAIALAEGDATNHHQLPTTTGERYDAQTYRGGTHALFTQCLIGSASHPDQHLFMPAWVGNDVGSDDFNDVSVQFWWQSHFDRWIMMWPSVRIGLVNSNSSGLAPGGNVARANEYRDLVDALITANPEVFLYFDTADVIGLPAENPNGGWEWAGADPPGDGGGGDDVHYNNPQAAGLSILALQGFAAGFPAPLVEPELGGGDDYPRLAGVDAGDVSAGDVAAGEVWAGDVSAGT